MPGVPVLLVHGRAPVKRKVARQEEIARLCPVARLHPSELEGTLQLRDGSAVPVRPIKPEDDALVTRFVDGLSAQSRYQRFLNQIAHLSPQLLNRFTHTDYGREMALVALSPEDGEFIGVARYTPNADGARAEFALTVADAWQRRGLGHACWKSDRLCPRGGLRGPGRPHPEHQQRHARTRGAARLRAYPPRRQHRHRHAPAVGLRRAGGGWRAVRGGVSRRAADSGVEPLQRVDDDARDDEPRVLLVVGGDDVPGRVARAGRREAGLVGLHVLLPVACAPRCRRG